MKVFEHHGEWPTSVEKSSKRGDAPEQGVRAPKGKKVRGMKQAQGPADNQPSLSAQAIRDKVEISKGGAARSAPKLSSAGPSSAMPEVEAPEPKADVSLNDPNDPATVGKLKDMMSSGAVNFSESQRGVLEKILAER